MKENIQLVSKKINVVICKMSLKIEATNDNMQNP